MVLGPLAQRDRAGRDVLADAQAHLLECHLGAVFNHDFATGDPYAHENDIVPTFHVRFFSFSFFLFLPSSFSFLLLFFFYGFVCGLGDFILFYFLKYACIRA